MPMTLHEWKCGRCGQTVWSRCKPPKPIMHNGKPMFAAIFRAPLCPRCKVPIHDGTGNTQKRYSLRELL